MKHDTGFLVVGLGNPGEEYRDTRHNVGRIAVERVHELLGGTSWRDERGLRALVAEGDADAGSHVTCLLPEGYMNRSGGSVAPLIRTNAQAERLIVVHDDIDLPLGVLRIVFDRGAGGHKGVLSIERALKTRAFIRVRVGVLPTTSTGKVRKPRGEDAVHRFILTPVKNEELEKLRAAADRAANAVLAIITLGRVKAMGVYNSTSQESSPPTRPRSAPQSKTS